MKSFKEILLEANITPIEALDILGINAKDASDPDKLKKAYRSASMNAHPDRGGSTDVMQKVNASYEILKNFKASFDDYQSRKTKREESEKSEKIKKDIIQNDMLLKFKPKFFVDYFEAIFNKKFKFEVTPLKFNTTAGFIAKFFDDEKDVLFHLDVTHPLYSFNENDSALGGGNISYKLNTSTYGFVHNKRQKIDENKWQSTHDHNVFQNPEAVFPKKKIEKIRDGLTRTTGKFQKRDFKAFMVNKCKAEYTDDVHVYIPVGQDYGFHMQRHVTLSYPEWRIWYAYKEAHVQTKSFGIFNRKDEIKNPKVNGFFMPETEQTAKTIELIVKTLSHIAHLSDSTVVNTINDFSKHYKAFLEKSMS